MKKSIMFVWLIAGLLSFQATAGLFASEQATPDEGIQFSIRFYNKEIYTTDPDRPILVQVGLRNNGPGTAWFSIPNQAVFQVAFKVMSAGRTGLYLPNSDKFNENRFNNQPVFFRDVAIQPDEEFNYVVNLRDFVDIKDSGVYTIAAEFYPSLLPDFQGARKQGLQSQAAMASEPMDDAYKSNILTLAVRPSLPTGTIKTYQDNIDEPTKDFLRRENKSPDEVISTMLQARQDQKEARFFLYMNVEDLYKRAPQYRRSYLAAAEEERAQILEDFKNELWKREEALSKVPSAFEILSTSYTANEATVVARLKFDGGDYLELREYRYALKRKSGFWEVYDYQVRNLGTERKGLR